ncbi:acylphosphatase [Paenarthrobacter aurescens]|jgi:acylphosphatase|uniref:Acylphosphatase n=1 Tax=Paenarthrobacter aurescens (strain TC1) TaxID=290340 RepID=ACYP_PAEAT|nr:acylphosphatase [Paenarthrobacter aurescens]A1R3U5.1 RecName: Full=Acylphosphatase; AltName: Full=Acylphosphate phosphohydrolase [Paenarthrobacter aurescens TC1]ABM06569.1 putative Acylphosphatase [Paenarthrobacter aurescens TC1]
MTDETLRLTARITGVVQGVGFRYWTARKADELLLKGTVRNSADGSVELVAEGSAADVDSIVKWLHSSRAPGRVENVDFQVSDATGEFDDFRIID